MVECQTAARPEVMWQGIVLQKVMMMKIMMIASAHSSKNELPPCLDVYVCTNCVCVCVCLCVGALCQRVSRLAIVYVCPCVTQPCDRYRVVTSIKQTTVPHAYSSLW